MKCPGGNKGGLSLQLSPDVGICISCCFGAVYSLLWSSFTCVPRQPSGIERRGRVEAPRAHCVIISGACHRDKPTVCKRVRSSSRRATACQHIAWQLHVIVGLPAKKRKPLGAKDTNAGAEALPSDTDTDAGQAKALAIIESLDVQGL